MKKIAFIGDSVFDNKPYVGNEMCHIEWAQKTFQGEFEPLLVAIDGSITLDTIKQVEKLDKEITHVIVSSGGNDAIHALNNFMPAYETENNEYKSEIVNKKQRLSEGRSAGISNMMFMNIVDAMSPQIYALNKIQESFRYDYTDLCKKLSMKFTNVMVCTIYDSIPVLSPILKTILSIFNDVIISVASDFSFNILDLRKICVEDRLYSLISPIEPSSEGSEIINKNISEILRNNGLGNNETRIFPKV